MADGLSYWLGRLGGQRVFARVGLGQRWTPGVTTLVFGRFVIGARAMVAPLAGARRLPFGKFVLCDAVGAMLWAGAFVGGGYAAGAQLGAVQQYWDSLSVVMQVVVALAVVAFVLVKCVGLTRVTMAVGAALIDATATTPASTIPVRTDRLFMSEDLHLPPRMTAG